MTLIRKMAALALSAATLLTLPADAGEASLQAKTLPAAPSPTPQPAPLQLMLIGLGLVVLAGRRKAVRSEPWTN